MPNPLPLVATGTLTPQGITLSWLTLDSSERPSTLTILDFVDELRGLATRTPAGSVRALIDHMDTSTQYSAGTRTELRVDKVGTLTCHPATNSAPQQTPPPTPQPPHLQSPPRPAPIHHPQQPNTTPPNAESPQVSTPDGWAPVIPKPRHETNASAPPAGPSVPRRRLETGTLLTTRNPTEPPRTGWRGLLARVGLSMPPSSTESTLRAAEHAVSQHWPGVRTIFIANPKGGVSKTLVTAILAAIFARYGGSGVAAWDNNETRGTLGWRTDQGPHTATVLDLLPNIENLLQPRAHVGDMARYLHHQPQDRYDVLRSDGTVTSDHEMTSDEVEEIHRVLAKYYRLIIVDSGNNERAANWRAALAHSDHLVIPMSGREDTAEAAALMLDSLHSRDPHSQYLAQTATAIVSQQTPKQDVTRISHAIAPLVKDVHTIPYDPALEAGVIRYNALRTITQRAWLTATGAIAHNL